MEKKLLKYLHFIVGGIIFLLAFFIGIFGIDLSLTESLLLAGFLGVVATAITWWQEHGW
jgi:VIT1/CCC1 family predicted Fe2+/Mn2+ transporter